MLSTSSGNDAVSHHGQVPLLLELHCLLLIADIRSHAAGHEWETFDCFDLQQAKFFIGGATQE